MSEVGARRQEPSLAGDGWTRRFTAIGFRLEEATALYRSLGFEIRLEPADAGAVEARDPSGCAQCLVMTLAQTIYTRPRAIGADDYANERMADRADKTER